MKTLRAINKVLSKIDPVATAGIIIIICAIIMYFN